MGLNGKIVFSSGISCDFDIWSLDLDSGSLLQLTNGINFNDFPRWSPNGSQIAYVSIQEDSIASLWIMDSDGQNKRRLTNNIYCQAPSWSPDGSHLIFCSNATDRNEIDVSKIGIDGSSPSTLFKYHGVEQTPSYSPDCKRVIFSAPATDNSKSLSKQSTDIVEYSLNDSSFRTVCSHPARDCAPVYSPDGNRIAFVSHRNEKSPEDYRAAYEKFKEIIINGTNDEGRTAILRMKDFEQDGDVFVVQKDGSELIQLTHDSRADNGVCWSPCGNYLMYTSSSINQHETERIKIIDARSGCQTHFKYDRSAFEQEIGTLQFLNATFLQRLIPDFIERKFLEGSLWGEERRPHWVR